MFFFENLCHFDTFSSIFGGCFGNEPTQLPPDFSLSSTKNASADYSPRTVYIIKPDFRSILCIFYNASSSLKQHPKLGSTTKRAFDLPKAKTFVHGVKNYYRDTNIRKRTQIMDEISCNQQLYL